MNKENLVKKLLALGGKVSDDLYNVESFEAKMLKDMVLVTNNGKLQYHLETDEGKFKFLTKKEFEVGDKIIISVWELMKDYNGRAKGETFITLS